MRKKAGARLKEERLRLGLNQTDFAKIGSASKRSQVDWEKGASPPNADYLTAIAAAGADVLYILTGQRAVPVESSLSREEECLLDNYRHCPDEGKRSLEAVSASFAQQAKLKVGNGE